jgi:hypothetical protein
MSKKSGKLRQSKDYRKTTFFKAGNWVRHAGGGAKERALQEKGKPFLQRVIEKVFKK